MRQPTANRRSPRATPGARRTIGLGETMRALRAGRELTLEQLAAQSGVSRAMLSKVERGEKSPTLAVVSKIAQGLGVSLSALIGAAPDPAQIVVIRKDQRLVFRDAATGFQRHLLSPTHVHNGVELLLHSIPPGQTSGPLPPYPERTEKYLIVTEGQLTAQIGDERRLLGCGDSLYFEVSEPYSFINEGDIDCVYHLVIVRPNPANVR